MVFRERKLTFKRILSWFTQEIAFCQLFGSGRLAKINFWFGNFTKSVILYLIQKMYFCEPKKGVYYPNEEEKSKQATSMEKYSKYMYCIAFTIISQTYFTLQRLFVDLFQKHKICEPIKVCQITRREYIIVFASIVTWNINIASHL